MTTPMDEDMDMIWLVNQVSDTHGRHEPRVGPYSVKG